MPHSLILGMTESGKTTLATNLGQQYKEAGIKLIVLDELRDPRWHADFITSDEEEFLDVFFASKSCAVFIDEAGDCDFKDVMQKTATRGRHWGHNVHYILQREVGIPKTVRAQCSKLFMFALSKQDRINLSNDFNAPILREANDLKRGEFITCDKFGSHQRLRVF